MNSTQVLTFIAALAAAAPTLSADFSRFLGAIQSLLASNPNATAAQIQAQIAAALADASSTDKQVERGV